MSRRDGDRDQVLDQALRRLPRAAPDPALDRRVHALAVGALAGPDPARGPVPILRRVAAAVAPALLALVVAGYFGWSVCFLLASRLALPG
jgi:hypothetical protein